MYMSEHQPEKNFNYMKCHLIMLIVSCKILRDFKLHRKFEFE